MFLLFFSGERSSVEIHTMEKNIIVVDVINEDRTEPKDHSVKQETTATIESTKSPKETKKKKVDELEVYDYEPRVRRSSSICSRETDAVSSSAGEEKGTERVESKEQGGESSLSEDVAKREVESTNNRYPKAKIVESGTVLKSGAFDLERHSKQDQYVNKLDDERHSRETKDSYDRDEVLSKSNSGETCVEGSQETVIENHLSKESSSSKGRSPVREDNTSRLSRDEEIESLIKREEDSENNLRRREGVERKSSESEVETEGGCSKTVDHEEADEERKGLFHQTDSMDDELPYVPTTLPQER